jgi:hypothetical protein
MSGCAEIATVLAGVNDELALEQGYYYEDRHLADHMTGDCSGLWERGQANNQSSATPGRRL